MSQGFFENWTRWDFERNGTQRVLPYFYYDNTSLVATYLAASSKVAQLIPDPRLKPVEMLPGRCIVAFAAFEYRKTDFEPYNEVSISFLISFGRRQIPGITAAKMILSRVTSSFVWQLPVNTEHARAGGADLFGYPKFLADIEFERNNDWETCILREGNQEILQLKGRKLPIKSGKLTRYITYAMDNGNPLSAEVLVNPLEYAETYHGRACELELASGHPVSDALKQIELGKRPLMYQYSPVNQAVLFPARNIIGNIL